jgi:glutamine synthetase
MFLFRPKSPTVVNELKKISEASNAIHMLEEELAMHRREMARLQREMAQRQQEMAREIALRQQEMAREIALRQQEMAREIALRQQEVAVRDDAMKSCMDQVVQLKWEFLHSEHILVDRRVAKAEVSPSASPAAIEPNIAIGHYILS